MADSLAQRFGFAPQSMGTVGVLLLILLIAPYAAGQDFGIFKVPSFSIRARRRLKLIAPVLCLVFAIGFAPWPAANRLENGGFEATGPEGTPRYWSWNGRGRGSSDEEIQRGGRRSLRLESPQFDHVKAIQRITLDSGTKYVLSGWIRTESVVAAGPGSGGGAFLAAFIDDAGEKRLWVTTVPLLGNHGWTRVDVRFTPLSPKKVEIQALLGLSRAPTSGSAWFDDLELRPVR